MRSSKHKNDKDHFAPLVAVKEETNPKWKYYTLSLYYYMATKVNCPKKFTEDDIIQAGNPYMKGIKECHSDPKEKYLASLV